MEQTKKVGRFVTNMMGVTVSLILGTIGPFLSGHFTIQTWIISVVSSMIIALLVGYIIPVKKIADKITQNIFSQTVTALVNNVIINVFYVLIIVSSVLFISLKVANVGMNKAVDAQKQAIVELNEQMTEENTEEIQKQIDELEAAIENINANRPSYSKELPMNLLWGFVISYVVTLILQPIFVNIGMKKYVYNIVKK